MPLRSSLLLILAALTVTAPPAAAVTDDDLQADLGLAQRVFPYACHQYHPVIQISDETMLDGLEAYTDIGGDSGCWIVLSADWPSWRPQWLCRTVLHEVGHLAGLEHTNNIHSIMYPKARLSRSRRCRYP